MSVCIYSPSENIWGGGQIYIENLCRYLNDAGADAVIATSEPDSFSCSTLTMPSVASKARRLQEAPAFAKRIKRQGYQVIVLNDLASLWLAPVFRAAGLKVVSLLHLYLQPRNSVGFGHGKVAYHMLRFGSRFCHRVFSVNKDNIKSLPVDVQFVGNFISPWFFEEPGDHEKRYDLGLIARLSVEKNVLLFIRLVAELNAISIRPINALIVGKGEEEAHIREEIHRLGMENNIDLQAWVERDQLPSIYDQVKCFAITSYHEGFATTLLEAHARGVPAISTRGSGFCAEYIEGFDGPTGMAFEPDEVSSREFLDNVITLIEESDSYYDSCIRKAQFFTEERVLGTIFSAITTLLEAPGKARAL